MGAFEAIHKPGRAGMVRFVNKSFKSFLKCQRCDESIKLKKSQAAPFFLMEQLSCQHFGTINHFPLAWLVSQMKLELN